MAQQSAAAPSGAIVGVIMGSSSDLKYMQPAIDLLAPDIYQNDGARYRRVGSVERGDERRFM